MTFGVARMNFRPRMSTVGENALTVLWVNAVGAANVSAGRRVLINNLFNSLDGFGLTPLISRLWLLAAENATCAAVDLMARASLTLVNSPTFTANQGYAGNGTSSYMNLGTAVGGTQNSSTIGLHCRTNQIATNSLSMGSGSSETNATNIALNWSDGKTYTTINDADSDTGRTSPASKIGIHILTRTAVNTVTYYKDGASFSTTAVTSTAPQARNVYLGACDVSAGAVSFTTNQIAMGMLASGFTATQALNCNTVIQTYMTAVGA